MDTDCKGIFAQPACPSALAIHNYAHLCKVIDKFCNTYTPSQHHVQYSNEHPIVRTHPETGNKILFVNPTYTKKILGIPENDSTKLLEKIFRHQERLDLSCRFKWTDNAIAILDNRCTQHYAIADFYPGRGLGHERIMDRIAIVGDQPF